MLEGMPESKLLQKIKNGRISNGVYLGSPESEPYFEE